MNITQFILRGLKRSIILFLEVTIKYIRILLSKLDKRDSFIEIADIQSKGNKLIYYFRTNLPHTEALYQIRILLNSNIQFLKLSHNKVFTIQTVYSNKITFSFCSYTSTIDGLITLNSIDDILNKYTGIYLKEIYGSVEIFNTYRVIVLRSTFKSF